MGILNINNSNQSLKFLERRIKSDDYRGLHLFQHYRYDLNFIKIVLTELYNHERTTGSKYLKIRTTDSSKRPENTPDEIEYARIISNIKLKTGKSTQDSIRKIVFVDCNRMGFLDRFDDNKNLIAPNCNFNKYSYVSLSRKGKKFLKSKNIKEEYFIFSSGLYRIFGNLLHILKRLIIEYDLNYVTKYEFMYFISAIDDNSSFSIDINKCGYLIKQFRLLGDIDRKNVTKILKQEMNPKKFPKNKKISRDFANWDNEATETFILLSTTVYFEVRNGIKLMLNSSDTSLDSIIGSEFKKRRSLQEKNNYFNKHNVSKAPGFELHHVVALEYADSPALYKLLDNWINMVYIDGYSHSIITQNNNKNVVMNSFNDDIILQDYSDSVVYLKNKKNILYLIKNKDLMLGYNNSLLNVL